MNAGRILTAQAGNKNLETSSLGFQGVSEINSAARLGHTVNISGHQTRQRFLQRFQAKFTAHRIEHPVRC